MTPDFLALILLAAAIALGVYFILVNSLSLKKGNQEELNTEGDKYKNSRDRF